MELGAVCGFSNAAVQCGLSVTACAYVRTYVSKYIYMYVSECARACVHVYYSEGPDVDV